MPKTKFLIGDRVTTQWGESEDDYIYPLPPEGGVILDVEVKSWGDLNHVSYVVGEIDPDDPRRVLTWFRIDEQHCVAVSQEVAHA